MRILIVAIFFFKANLYAQDYRVYHYYINNAERSFFILHNVDSAYYYYDKAFSEYNFVFAKDCFMAAQIAKFNGDNKYKQYLNKGFRYGLRKEDLNLSKILSPILHDTIKYKGVFSSYNVLRNQYLKSINVPILKKIIQMVSADHIEKNLDYKTYEPLIEKKLSYIETLINTVGFPADKNIGLSQEDILSELGYQGQDYDKWEFEHYYDNSIAQTKIYTLLFHHQCVYQYFSRYWQKLIASGDIHPRDVALLYDNALRLYDNPQYDKSKARAIAEVFGCNYAQPFGGYKINTFVSWKNLNCDRRIIDSMRKELYINPIYVDSVEDIYTTKYGFKTRFGFEDCR